MNKIIILFVLSLLFYSCENNFNIQNPNVKKFVKQLKEESYNEYAYTNEGEKLWLQMPGFTKDDIPKLIELSNDTTHINYFPTNPISSRSPWPNGRDYFILGECLLWIVEGIRIENGYGSLDPYLINCREDSPQRFYGVTGEEILQVRECYQNWWDNDREKAWQDVNPLDNTPFCWM